MTQTTLEMVKEFHEAFGHPVNNRPYLTNEDLTSLRESLITEELQELCDAISVKDETEVLDALCDLQYVLDGAFLALGFWDVKQEAMEEVHRSNMSKLGEDGKPLYREDGKILKGPDFKEPELEQFLLPF